MIEAWLKSAPRPTTFCAGVSAAALAMSFAGVPDLPADPAWIAVILCGVPILYVAGRGIMDGFDIRAGVLVSLALIAALLTKEYFAAGEVALIMQIGTLLEDWTVARARAGLEGLAALAPQAAHRLRGDVQETVPAAEVRAGDLLVVRAGETVPVDGTVTAGESAVDAAVMTGESLPVDKRAGDAVISGTVNTYGTFTMRAEKAATDSSLQRMIALAREADAKKAPIVRLADRWASWLVGIALACALLV
ncbi:MAG: cation-transporting P-type ATPase, partial [Selenomonas artemidis]